MTMTFDLTPHYCFPPPPRTRDPLRPRLPALRWLATNEWSSRPSHPWRPPRSPPPKPRRAASQPPFLLLPAQWPSRRALPLPSRFQPPTPQPRPPANPPLTFRWGQPSLGPSIKSPVGTVSASSPSAALPMSSTCPPSQEVPTSLTDRRNLAFPQCLMEGTRNITSQVFPKEEAWAAGDLNQFQPNNTNLQVPRRPTSQMYHQAWPPTTLDRTLRWK